MELLKHYTDKLLIAFLKLTSGFAKELTSIGYEEQKAWREQRLRNLKGLSLMSQQRHAKNSRVAE
jgi:hypothetical protein